MVVNAASFHFAKVPSMYACKARQGGHYAVNTHTRNAHFTFDSPRFETTLVSRLDCSMRDTNFSDALIYVVASVCVFSVLKDCVGLVTSPSFFRTFDEETRAENKGIVRYAFERSGKLR